MTGCGVAVVFCLGESFFYVPLPPILFDYRSTARELRRCLIWRSVGHPRHRGWLKLVRRNATRYGADGRMRDPAAGYAPLQWKLRA